jgi:hypothetical protein
MIRRWHHLSAGVAALALLVALSAPWFTLQVPTGMSITLRGLEASAVSSTLLGAAAAAYGASLLIRGLGRRILGVLQTLLGAGAASSWIEFLEAPALSVQATITSLTGLAGSAALEGVTVIGPSWFFALGVFGAVAVALSGVLGVVAPDSSAASSRYERNPEGGDVGDPIATWDDLSEGHDPTKR